MRRCFADERKTHEPMNPLSRFAEAQILLVVKAWTQDTLGKATANIPQIAYLVGLADRLPPLLHRY